MPAKQKIHQEIFYKQLFVYTDGEYQSISINLHDIVVLYETSKPKYNGQDDSEFILEKLLHRRNWTINVRDAIQSKLEISVVKGCLIDGYQMISKLLKVKSK